MQVERITEHSIITPSGEEIVLFLLQPTNVSVLSRESLRARVNALMNVLKGFVEVELLCLNSRESFEHNSVMEEAEVLQTFLDLIAPAAVRFEVDRYMVGNTFRCVWAVRGYPTSTEEQALLQRLGERAGVTLHIYTRLVSPAEERKILQAADKANRFKGSGTDIREIVEAQSNLKYRLGKLLLPQKETAEAIQWLTASAEQGNQFAQYTLGKLYLLGKEDEIEHSRETAVYWLTLAANQGNQYAQYFLIHLDDFRQKLMAQGVTRILNHLGNLFQERQPPAPGGLRVRVDHKLKRKIQEKKAAQGHKRDDHEPVMTS